MWQGVCHRGVGMWQRVGGMWQGIGACDEVGSLWQEVGHVGGVRAYGRGWGHVAGVGHVAGGESIWQWVWACAMCENMSNVKRVKHLDYG